MLIQVSLYYEPCLRDLFFKDYAYKGQDVLPSLRSLSVNSVVVYIVPEAL